MWSWEVAGFVKRVGAGMRGDGKRKRIGRGRATSDEVDEDFDRAMEETSSVYPLLITRRRSPVEGSEEEDNA